MGFGSSLGSLSCLEGGQRNNVGKLGCIGALLLLLLVRGSAVLLFLVLLPLLLLVFGSTLLIGDTVPLGDALLLLARGLDIGDLNIEILLQGKIDGAGQGQALGRACYVLRPGAS